MPVTLALIATCCVVFAITESTGDSVRRELSNDIDRLAAVLQRAADHEPRVVVAPETFELLPSSLQRHVRLILDVDDATSCYTLELETVRAEPPERLDATRAACELQRDVEAEAARFVESYARLPSQRWGYSPAHPTLSSAVTSIFVHGGWGHLLGNIWYLFLAGALAERSWGRGRYLAFYMLCGVFAVFAHQAASLGSDTPLVGASGAIAALLGACWVTHPSTDVKFAYFWMFPRPRFGTVDIAIGFAVGAWFVLQLFYAFLSDGSGVAFWAHVGGFVLGAGFSWLFARWGWIHTETDDTNERVARDVEVLRENMRTAGGAGRAAADRAGASGGYGVVAKPTPENQRPRPGVGVRRP
ncbi:MAG: rhomboid family intramembrane serine protease [Myxococcales bacterium]|nr:rhomboid family intramembrane serine protease [Myxococcales bacterium]